MNNYKIQAVSFAQTFLASFVLYIGTAISELPIDRVMSGEVFGQSIVIGLIVAAARAALKVAWEKAMPVSLGGK
jgi:hypothetical protein